MDAEVLKGITAVPVRDLRRLFVGYSHLNTATTAVTEETEPNHGGHRTNNRALGRAGRSSGDNFYIDFGSFGNWLRDPQNSMSPRKRGAGVE
jgi:hypothetical protein